MLVPITKTIWQGKVGTRDSGACNVTVPITSVPITNIYCTRFTIVTLVVVVVVHSASFLLRVSVETKKIKKLAVIRNTIGLLSV